jgi:hypothetical protein
MIVVHFTKVSALYSRVVISSLRRRLEKLLFAILYTSFGVWPRDHYMPLQRFTMGHMLGLAKVSRGSTRYHDPSWTMWARANDHATSHSSEQDTLPTTSLINKQAIPYQTRGGTCCPGLSTLKTRSLANSFKTNHKVWRSQPSPPFQTLFKL